MKNSQNIYIQVFRLYKPNSKGEEKTNEKKGILLTIIFVPEGKSLWGKCPQMAILK